MRLLERDDRFEELQTISKNCNDLVSQLVQDNKILKRENRELRSECERIEGAYADIMKEFTKMTSI